MFRSCVISLFITIAFAYGGNSDRNSNTNSEPAAPAVTTIDWLAGFGNTDAQSRYGTAGETLQFNWDGDHNVYLMPSLDAFINCDFSSATNLGATSGVTYTVNTFPTYFACEVNTHCQSGQKLAVTLEPTTVTVSGFSQYPGSSEAAYTGSATMAFAGTSVTITHSLSTYDSACESGPKAGVDNSCGIHIHSGTCGSADEVGGHYYPSSTSDPWATAVYANGEGSNSVDFGYSYNDAQGRALVIHNSDGDRITCDIIPSQSGAMRYGLIVLSGILLFLIL